MKCMYELTKNSGILNMSEIFFSNTKAKEEKKGLWGPKKGILQLGRPSRPLDYLMGGIVLTKK